MTWQAILDGDLADRGWAALRAIADDMRWRRGSEPDLALFWSYVNTALDGAYEEALDPALEALGERIGAKPAHAGLHGGLAGKAFALAHCTSEVDDVLDAIDGALATALREWRGHYDLITGLVGIGAYFLERGDAPSARAGLALVVDRLVELAKHTDAGVTWHTPVHDVPPHERERNPDGWYNCGLAHGVPGPLWLLGRIEGDPRTPALRDGAIAWLLAQHGSMPERSRFPTIAGPNSGARTAWCYGDPGVLIAMFDAASRAGQPTAEYEQLALAALARSSEVAGVVDPALCHGAAGLAHIANRMFQATGDARFRDAARTWFARVLDFRGSEGIGGFRAFRHDHALGVQTWQDAPDLLDGVAGIGLALASALAPLEPSWDRILLLG